MPAPLGRGRRRPRDRLKKAHANRLFPSDLISDSPAGATPGITPFGRSQAGCPRHSDGAGGGSGIDSKKLTPSGYFLRSAIASLRRIAWYGANSVGVGSEVRRALLGLAFGLALAVRPTGSAEAPRARAGPEDAFCGAVCAERLERIFGLPLRVEGPTWTMCGVPARWLWP